MHNYKKMSFCFLSILLLFVVSGCGSSQSEENEKATALAEVTIIVTTDNGEEKVAEETVSFKAGTDLYAIMKENFEIEDQSGFITSINGLSQDESASRYWLFEVNDKPAMEGAKKIKPKNGDKISWDLHGNS